MRTLNTISAFTIAALALFALGITAQLGAEETPAGQQVFEQEKCGLCHSVASAGIEAKTKSEKMRGTDLGGYEAEDVASLMAYLRQEEERDGAKHRRKLKASDEEVQALLDWLGSLEAAPADAAPGQ